MLRLHVLALMVVASGLVSSCSVFGSKPETTLRRAGLEPATNLTTDLLNLPKPKGKITAAVYGFRDQTGQYKQSPDSSFSTAVSQGGAAMLIRAMTESGWFTAVEREGLQDLLTERKILRALDQPEERGGSKPPPSAGPELPSLTPARLLLQGTVVGYDFNVSTGGIGVKYLGLSLADQYRKDQVTVNLRAVDTSNGRVLHSISTTKTVYSKQIQPGVYKFVSFKKLLEAEAGYTYNEPVQLAVQEAIEQALLSVIVEGVFSGSWRLADDREIRNPLLQRVYAEIRNRGVEEPSLLAKLQGVSDKKPEAAVPKATSPKPGAPASEQNPGTEAPAVEETSAFVEPPKAPRPKPKRPEPPPPPDESFQSIDREQR